METLKAPETQKLRSFDVLAGVNAYQYDLQAFGRILPETRRQVRDEHLSYFAEGSKLAARTCFVFERDGDDYAYFDDGRLRPYSEMIDAGIDAAAHDTQIDPRRAFLLDWAKRDKYQHEQNRKLRPGEKRTWANLYPIEQEELYGPDFMNSCGLFAERRLGFIYQATCNQDASLSLESQTIDRSDPEAVAAALDAANTDPSLDLDNLVEVYDQVLEQKFATKFYAGRSQKERIKNAWQEILKNSDLITHLDDGLESIARYNYSPHEKEVATKKHLIGTWALFKMRLDGTAIMPEHIVTSASENNAWLSQQVESAYQEFVKETRYIIGCGGMIRINDEEDLLNARPEDILKTVFSSKKIQKCVRCPLCRREGVDAKIEEKGKVKTITCSECKESKSYAITA